MPSTDTYALLDSGDGLRLEQLGPYRIVRPAPSAAYPKSAPELWSRPDAVHVKNESGGGEWELHSRVPEDFPIQVPPFTIRAKLTPFGHIGFFPEQRFNWDFLLAMPGDELEVLNLFAYTGLATLAALKRGHAVCHVDSSRGMVQWASENARLSGLGDAHARWIVEDALKFVRREVKRGKRYQGFILDPPAFGRGIKGEVWKLERDLMLLLPLLIELADGGPDFIILSNYTHGFGPLNSERLLRTFAPAEGRFFAQELSIPESTGRLFAAGACAYYLAPRIANHTMLPKPSRA